MKNKSSILALAILAASILVGVQQSEAQTIFYRIGVEANQQTQQVGGFIATYVTYDIYADYDPAAFGVLRYLNPTEQIDQDGGIGTNDYLYGYYPGYKADFTTNDYRLNKILCTVGEHGLQEVYSPTPFQWFDPYGFGSTTPLELDGNYDIEVTNTYEANRMSGLEYIPLALNALCLQTPTVSSVWFQTVNSPVTNDNPQSLGGGERVFPDKQSHNDSANRRVVRVKAQLAPFDGLSAYESGVRIYFRNYDVDDPSSDTVIDASSAGDDNRGLTGTTQSAGTLSSCTSYGTNRCYATTNSQGVATADFTVTMQPGDNFRIAASTDQNYLNGVVVNGTGLNDSSSAPLPSTRAKQTSLLTVWRRVHLEVDSMATVGNNVNNGLVAAKTTVGSTPVWLTLSGTLGYEAGRFVGGRIPAGSANLSVLDNTGTALQVVSDSGSVTLFANSVVQIFDDDDYNDSNGSNKIGDDQENIEARSETFSLLQASREVGQNVFAAAYIEPEYGWAQNQSGMNDPNVQFILNLDQVDQIGSNERAYFTPYWDSSGMESDDFWIGYIVLGYQSNLEQDADGTMDFSVLGGIAPADSVGDVGHVAASSLDVPKGSVGAIVYLETMTDLDRTLSFSWKSRVTPHELGHQFGLAHDPTYQIMDAASNDISLHPDHINLVRWRISSPGQN